MPMTTMVAVSLVTGRGTILTNWVGLPGHPGKNYKRNARPQGLEIPVEPDDGESGMRNREQAGFERALKGCSRRAGSPARKGPAMRHSGHSLFLLTVLGLLSGSAIAQSTAKDLPKPAALLKLRPNLAGIEYDTPPDEATKSACKVESVVNADGKSIGYALRDPQGKMLRRFVRVRGEHMDEWSYYQDGFEVYREVDSNGDTHLDECRWLNSGGSRICLIERGKVAAWKQISAEEASKVFVQALVAGDAALLESVMATPAELIEAGVPKDVAARVATAAEKRVEQLAALQKQLIGWNAQTVWNRFDGTFPHVIPADPAIGLSKDVTLYENAMAIPGTSASQQNAAKMAFLQIPDMIQLGSTWKFVELPHAIDPEKPIVASTASMRSMLFDRAANVGPAMKRWSSPSRLWRIMTEKRAAPAERRQGGDRAIPRQSHSTAACNRRSIQE